MLNLESMQDVSSSMGLDSSTGFSHVFHPVVSDCQLSLFKGQVWSKNKLISNERV